MTTGRPIVNPEKSTRQGEDVRDICPTASGRRTGTPAASLRHRSALHTARKHVYGQDGRRSELHCPAHVCRRAVHIKPGPGGIGGELTAWDPVARHPVWPSRELSHLGRGPSSPRRAGVLRHHGRWFKAVDAQNRSARLRFKVDSRNHQPARQLSRARRTDQYIAVLSGVGGLVGRRGFQGRSIRANGTAALGMVTSCRDLPKYTTRRRCASMCSRFLIETAVISLLP